MLRWRPEATRVNYGGEQLQIVDVRCCQCGTLGGCRCEAVNNLAIVFTNGYLSNRLQTGKLVQHCGG
jgi:hypothetical protein